jgi:TctA family transporter
MMMYQGDITQMVFRPISGTIYLISAIALIAPYILRAIKRRKEQASTA